MYVLAICGIFLLAIVFARPTARGTIDYRQIWQSLEKSQHFKGGKQTQFLLYTCPLCLHARPPEGRSITGRFGKKHTQFLLDTLYVCRCNNSVCETKSRSSINFVGANPLKFVSAEKSSASAQLQNKNKCSERSMEV